MAVLALGLAAGGPVLAGESKPSALPMRVKKVALFKNGLGFVVAEVALRGGAGERVLIRLPVTPSHGTFWVSYPASVKVRDLVARQAAEWEERQPASLPELLRANVGRQVKVWLSADTHDFLDGRLISVPEAPVEPAPDPYSPGMTVPGRDRYGPGARLALLQRLRGEEVAFDTAQVYRLELEPGAPRLLKVERKVLDLEARLAAPAPASVLTATALIKGITWAPSYAFDISRPQRARVAAKAVVINEAADLDDVELALVTGFPHLRFADVPSPMAMKQPLAQFLTSLTEGEPGADRSRRRSVVTQQAELYYGEASAVLPEYGAAAVGQAVEDLFLYPVHAVSLAKGETGYFPLFTAQVPYEHVYLWDVPDYVNEQDTYREEPREEQPEVVWHCLRLKNETTVPWTTAPAQTVSGDQILGQDVLNYTPVGAEQTLRVTQAVGVKAEQAEFETARVREAKVIYGYNYDKVTVEGKLAVKNFKGEPIVLEITKTLSGELKSSTPEAKVQKQARGLKRLNPESVLKWTVELKAGAAVELGYVYEVLVRR
jgi:hypothetical protein